MNYQTPTAVLALLLWIPISVFAYWYLHPRRATVILLLGATMFLPQLTAFKIPLIPQFDKQSIATLCVFFGCLFTAPQNFRTMNSGWLVKLFLLMALIGIVGSVTENLSPLHYGPTIVPALQPRNIITFILDLFFFRLIPLFCGAAFFKKVRNLEEFLSFLVKAELIYALLILIEIRLSPQLNTWVYGFKQNSWLQNIRMGGYRPVVFMTHGLALALFTASATVAATGLAKARIRVWGIPTIIPPLFLMVLLVLSRSFGALILGIVCVPLIVFASVRLQIRAAIIICSIVILYPLLRANDLFPTEQLVQWGTEFSEQRGGSLAFRFYNEDLLLEKAMKRPIFGWGGFARIRVFDPKTGYDLTVTDGAWIIDLSGRGFMGFLSMYGLIIWPVFLAYRNINRISEKTHRSLVGCICLIVAINAVDLVPNGLFTYLPYLYSGVLLGVIKGLVNKKL